MTEIVPSAQMRAAERAVIDSGAVTGQTLMERAGEAVVAAIFAHWPQLDDPKTQVVVLCGPGNNGGDGYVIARHLQLRGLRPWAIALGDPATLPPDARAMQALWSDIGQTLCFGAQTLQDIADRIDPERALVVVDALFGIGLSRPLAVAVLVPWAAFMARVQASCWCVAVDVPSGVSDQMPLGTRLAGFDREDLPRLTVTFHTLKDAHRAMLAAQEQIVVADIGLPAFGVSENGGVDDPAT